MKLELKRVKINQRLSEETTCFSADLYVEGVKVAQVCNRGHGGCNEYAWECSRERANEIETWAAAQPTEFRFEKLDQLVDELLFSQEMRQQFVRWCKTKVMFRLKDDLQDDWRSLRSSGPINLPAARRHLEGKYGDRLEMIANEDIDAAVAVALRKE